MERNASCIIEFVGLSYHSHRTPRHTTSPLGGEVPRLVAVQGEIDASGKYAYALVPPPSVSRRPTAKTHSCAYNTKATQSTATLPMNHYLCLPSRPQYPPSGHTSSYALPSQHPVNHVLIQLYRTGADHISEHSDKMIDVVRGSRIVSLSLG